MRELPTGTVTFLFTDIEGSTRLLHELGDGYADALAEHRRLLREAFACHGGVEVDTQGDAFFVAFARATDALSAADGARRALEPGPIRVRMGLHTGEPQLTDEGYVGLDVHRAARISAAGHGGQVLLSGTTHDLLGTRADLHDLGTHRLKDLTAPERLYQLGSDDFPPLRSLNQTNLPLQPSPLVGRKRELDEVLELLHGSRLLTLTGPGGGGKTRLAVQAAAEVTEEFPDGVWFVSLAALRDPELVAPTIASAVDGGDELIEALGDRRLLLVLDNCEQLLPGIATDVAELLERTPAIVLATSRERLALGAEQEYVVPTLTPEDAMALFTARARQLTSSFEPDEHVAEIGRRLDGLPLAIELAAARVKVMRPQQILERLGSSELLTAGLRDAPERQRTLRATIGWSHELLAEDERRLFARLAVFPGSFELEAAETVCSADVEILGSLIDKSLLRQTSDGRFFMLETIREYAAERLEESGEAGPLSLRHAGWTLKLAERAGPELEGRHQVEWLDGLELERDNIRTALATFAGAGRHEERLRLATAVWRLWLMRGSTAEGARVVESALASAPTDAAPGRLAGLRALGYLAYAGGRWTEAAGFHEQGLELSRRAGDRRAEALALFGLYAAATGQRDLRSAKQYAEEAEEAAREVSDHRTAGVAAASLGHLALHERDYVRARSLFERSMVAMEGEEYGQVANLGNLALVALRLGELHEAAAKIRENLVLSLRLHDHVSTVHALAVLAAVLAGVGQPEVAARVLGAGAALEEDEGLSLQELEAELRDETEAAVRDELGELRFEDELEAGRTVELSDLIGTAIGRLG
ncbi:MAG: adenylate/guanylate cyclase domain-containing protein [Actinobacteria bacterium]|nr:MAG: adenylate/guanylate cyclase domain-containing protein [Actinomycetota bacterium]